MHWRLLILMAGIQIVYEALTSATESGKDNQSELVKRDFALAKFKMQLLSVLHLPSRPVGKFDKSPKQKWLEIPFSVRKRLESHHALNVKSQLDIKEIFVPVNKLENCSPDKITEFSVCVEFHIGNTNEYKRASSAMFYVDLPNTISYATHYEIRKRDSENNETVKLIHQNGKLMKADISSLLNKSWELFSTNKHEFKIICTHKCGINTFANVKIYLEISFVPKPKLIRKRRSTETPTSCVNNEVFCCRRSFKIRPIDLDLEYIVHPNEFDISYCSGQCNDFIKSNTYRKVITILKRSKTSNLSPNQIESMKSCCAPETYDGVEMIVNNPTQDNNSFQTHYIDNIIVSKCACI